MPKIFSCSACNGQHKRPVGAKCQNKHNDLLEVSTSSTQSNENVTDSLNHEILAALNTVSSRLSTMEQRMDKTETSQNKVSTKLLSSQYTNAPKSYITRTVYSKHTFSGISVNWKLDSYIYLFGVLHRFQHCTGHITTGSWKGRGNQYIQFVRDPYCKLPTNSKQLPAFPLEAMTGIEPRPQRCEVRVLPLWPTVAPWILVILRTFIMPK